MTGTTNAELVEEVNRLKYRLSRFEQQRVDSAHDSFSITNGDAKEISCDPNWLNHIYKDAPVGLCYLDTQLRYININEWLAALNGLNVKDHLGHTLSELFPKLAIKLEPLLRQVIQTGEPIQERSICSDPKAQQGVLRYFQHNFDAVKSVDGHVVGVSCTVTEITEYKRAELLLEGEKKVLEVISSLKSHDGGLTELVEFIESQSDGMTCSILLMDDDGLHLRHGAAINLPEEYNRAIDGMDVGPGEGSCGTAAYLNQTVIVSDIASDPRWVNFRDLGMKHGIRACWSIPIQSSTGHVLGTFAMYYNKPRKPDTFHLMLTERAVHLAAISIERKNAERKLTQSEENLRRAQRIAHVGSFELKPNLNPINWSDECYRIVGLEPGSKLPSRSQLLKQIIHPDDQGFADRTLQKSLKDRTPFRYEYRVRRPNGSIRWVQSRGEPLLDDTGQIVSIQGTVIDITDRKLTLDRLDEFNVALSNAMPGISRLDIDGLYVEVNNDYAKVLGYEPHELIGGPWNPTVHPDDMEEVVQAYQEMCRDGKAEFEARAVRKDGSFFYKQVLMVRINDPNGTMTGHHCFMRDISERKLAEVALLESNDRFRTIFESVPECVKLLDKDGILLDMNAAGLSMIEADSIEQVRGESVYSLIAPEHLDTFITNQMKVFEGESNTQEFEIIGLRGTHRWMETHQVPLRDIDGNTTSLLAVTHDVTKRKHVEEARRASEIWFRSIFEQVGVAVGVVESDSGVIVRVNSKYANLLGYSIAELIGKTWMELTHPEDLLKDQNRMDELNANQIRDFSIEKRLIHKTGSVIWINLTVSPMWQPDETPGQHVVIIEDITARKYAEAEIQSRAKQQAVVAELGQRALSGADPSELFDKSLSVISTVLDAEYAKVLKLLPDGKSLIFRAAEGWNGRKLQGHVISIQSRSQAAATLRLQEPIVVEDMNTDRRFDATQSLSDHDIVSGITVIISGQNRIFGVLGVHSCKKREFTKRDISFLQAIANILGEAIDRKHAEIALKESEQRLRLVTDAMPAFISYLGVDRCYKFVNKCYESTFGLERSQIVGKPVWELLGTEYYESIKPRIDSVLDGNSEKYESDIQVKNLGKRTLRTEHVPDRAPDGSVRGFYSLAVDITEQKTAEEQAFKQRDELAHMSRISTMGEMATGIAHELNQPLTAIASYSFAASNIINQLNLSQTELQDILDKLEDQAIRAGDIVRRLRNFIKKTESVRVVTDLNMLIRDVAKFLEPDSRQSETRLAFQFFEPSPIVSVDEIQIQQVLVNLIRNAIDAMQNLPTSQRKVTVSTQTLQDGQAEIAVSDSGIGLSDEQLKQVFDAFFSTKQDGMGMGLPISRSIVEVHGGKLFAEMNQGSGMTFKFIIPQEENQ